jgi:capsular polysaccharide biosynthesis protein
MANNTESKAVERSCRIFRRLLAVYPRAHREEYGPAILQLFRDQCRDAWAAGRSLGVAQLWLHALADLLKTSILEHLSTLNRRKSMLASFRPRLTPFPVFLSVFAAVFLLVAIGSIVITLLLPEIYRSRSLVTVEQEPPAMSFDPYFLQTEFEIIQSPAVLDTAIENLNLREVWGSKYNRGVPLNNSDAERILKRSLELQPVRNTKVVEIAAFSDTPEGAAGLANGVAEAYREYREQEVTRKNKGGSIQRRVNIIDLAMPERIPVRPNKPANTILGAIVGIFLGMAAGATAAGIIYCLRENRAIPPKIADTVNNG